MSDDISTEEMLDWQRTLHIQPIRLIREAVIRLTNRVFNLQDDRISNCFTPQERANLNQMLANVADPSMTALEVTAGLLALAATFAAVTKRYGGQNTDWDPVSMDGVIATIDAAMTDLARRLFQ